MRTKFITGFASLVGFFWIFTAINPFYLWNSYENILKLFIGGLVVIGTLLLYSRNKLILTKKRTILAFTIFIFFIYLTSRLDAWVLSMMIRFFVFFPFMLLTFWRNEVLYKLYLIFRTVIVFFAIGSIVIALCSVTGVLQYLPYYAIEAQSNVHEMNNWNYHVYGCIVTLHGYLSSFIPRACGPLQEPGHFSIILGFVFMIDRFINMKVSKWIVACGMLTFSMNFFVLAGLGELYDMMFNKAGLKKLKVYMSILVLGIVVFLLLNKSLQDQFMFLFYERNLEQVMDSYMSTKSLSGALDERINQTGAFYYGQLIHSSKAMYGLGKLDKEVVLSDYRGMILLIGYIGFVLSIILASASLLGARFQQAIFLICAIFLIYIHRAWMMQQPYIYFFVFLSICMYNYYVSGNKIYNSK